MASTKLALIVTVHLRSRISTWLSSYAAGDFSPGYGKGELGLIHHIILEADIPVVRHQLVYVVGMD